MKYVIHGDGGNDYIYYQLQSMQFIFKHKCFESEKEVRAVFYRPICKHDNFNGELPKINYRAENGLNRACV